MRLVLVFVALLLSLPLSPQARPKGYELDYYRVRLESVETEEGRKIELIRNFRPSSFIDPAGIVGSLPNAAEVTERGYHERRRAMRRNLRSG